MLERSPMDGRASFAGILLVLLITWVIPAVTQNSGLAGLSIDCGSDVNYTDEKGIYWVTDVGYIDTGKNIRNLNVSSNYTILNQNQSKSLRYFDDGRGRDCYVLPVTPQYTYLVCPTFYYGDWDNPANATSFDVYLKDFDLSDIQELCKFKGWLENDQWGRALCN